jgi:hypothetical protein
MVNGMEIDELELRYLDEFIPHPEDIVNCRREKTQKLDKRKTYVLVGTIGERFVYQTMDIRAYDSQAHIINEKNIGEIAILIDKKLVGTTMELMEKYNEILTRTESYKKEKEVEHGIYIRYDEDDKRIEGKINEANLLAHERVCKQIIDNSVLERLKEKADAEARRLKEEAELKIRLEQETKGILEYDRVKITDKQVVEIPNPTFKKDKDIVKIKFDKMLKIDRGQLYMGEIDTYSSNGIDLANRNLDVEKTFIHDAVLNKKSFEIYTTKGLIVKIEFNDKERASINGVKCPKNIIKRIVDGLVHEGDSVEDIKAKVDIYRTLGVRKQKITEMDKIEMGRDIGRLDHEESKDIMLPIIVTPIDEDYADVEFAVKTMRVSWDELVKEFIYGNDVRTSTWGSNRLKVFMKWGWTKQELFYYFKQFLVQEAI